MSNWDEVRERIEAKFEKALGASDAAEIVMPLVRLALLDMQAVFDAILLQRQDEADRLRLAESHAEQLVRLNLWMQEYANDLFQSPGNTADGVLAALERQQGQIARLRRELSAVLDGRNFADGRLAALEQQIVQMDADNAKLTQEMQRLRSNALAVAAQNGKSAPGGFVLSEAAHDYLLGLEAGRWKWRQIPKSVQVELVRSIIATTEDRTQAQFDACKPAYMPTATAHVATFATTWRELADLSREIEVAL